MTIRRAWITLILLWLLPLCGTQAGGQGKAPVDKPVPTNAEQAKKLEEAIAPYVKQARETLPAAKNRFLKGLPKGEVFYITIRVLGPDDKYEQVFVRVTSWQKKTVKGELASDITLFEGHKKGELVVCAEKDILDWTISKPDGTEEGNFVGKFLDTYQP